MNQGCLADYRPLSDTQLVTTTALDLPALIQCVALGLGVAAVPAVLAPKLGSDVKVLSLVGAAPCELHAVRRRSDTSEPVLELLRLLSPVAIKAALEPQAAGQAFHPG
jgi:DNA-binding transcriptional LysR family regulator